MSSDNKSIDEYPHWKAALFDSEKAVNLRCFVKYCTWHGSYALLAAGVVAWAALSKAVNAFPSERVSASASTAGRAATNPKVKKGARYTFRGIVAAILIGAVALLGWLFITRPLEAGAALALSVAVGAAIFGLVFVNDWLKSKGVHAFIKKKVATVGSFIGSLLINDTTKETATVVVKKGKTAKQKAPDTKGVRRVYGQCPVNMNITPKWFDKYVEDE